MNHLHSFCSNRIAHTHTHMKFEKKSYISEFLPELLLRLWEKTLLLSEKVSESSVSWSNPPSPLFEARSLLLATSMLWQDKPTRRDPRTKSTAEERVSRRVTLRNSMTDLWPGGPLESSERAEGFSKRGYEASLVSTVTGKLLLFEEEEDSSPGPCCSSSPPSPSSSSRSNNSTCTHRETTFS